MQHIKPGWHRSASQPNAHFYAGSYEGPIVSFPSDAAGQAEAVQNAAATPRARPLSRLANVSHTLLAFISFPPCRICVNLYHWQLCLMLCCFNNIARTLPLSSVKPPLYLVDFPSVFCLVSTAFCCSAAAPLSASLLPFKIL